MSRQTDCRRVPRRPKHHASNGVLAAFASRLRDSTRSSFSPLIRDPFAASGCTKMSADFTCPERGEIGHFADSQADVGKLVAENYYQTANNEAPRGKRDRGRDRKPVSSSSSAAPALTAPTRGRAIFACGPRDHPCRSSFALMRSRIVSKDGVLLEKVRIAIATSRQVQRTAENFIAESDALLRALRELTRSPSTAAPRPERDVHDISGHVTSRQA
jgi:hypothetical protein